MSLGVKDTSGRCESDFLNIVTCFSDEFKYEKPLVFNHKIKVAFRGRTSERDKVFYSAEPVEDSATECGVHVLAV